MDPRRVLNIWVFLGLWAKTMRGSTSAKLLAVCDGFREAMAHMDMGLDLPSLRVHPWTLVVEASKDWDSVHQPITPPSSGRTTFPGRDQDLPRVVDGSILRIGICPDSLAPSTTSKPQSEYTGPVRLVRSTARPLLWVGKPCV